LSSGSFDERENLSQLLNKNFKITASFGNRDFMRIDKDRNSSSIICHRNRSDFFFFKVGGFFLVLEMNKMRMFLDVYNPKTPDAQVLWDEICEELSEEDEEE